MFPVEYRPTPAHIEIAPSDVPSTAPSPRAAEVLTPLAVRTIDSPNSAAAKVHNVVIPRLGHLGNFSIIGRNHSIRIVAG